MTSKLDRLLDLLSVLLSGQPYKPLGAPASIVRADNSSANRDHNANQVRSLNLLHLSDTYTNQAPAVEKSPELLTLALTTLGSFDFSGRLYRLTLPAHFLTCLLGHVLNEFVRNCALPYLEEESPEVRRAAAQTCCRLFDKDPICYQASNHSTEIVSDVLDKLLTVGIADPGES